MNNIALTVTEESMKDSLPPDVYADHLVMAFGVLGDYKRMNEGLLQLEDERRKRVQITHAAKLHLQGGMPLSNAVGAWGLSYSAAMLDLSLHNEYAELFNIMTLRGICKLEAGETETAREIFEKIQTDARDRYRFGDQAIVKRYLELLEKYSPKTRTNM
jgi:hypothetical protein